MSAFKLSRRSYDRLTGVDTRHIALAERAIEITPIDFGIAWMGGKRTAEDQNVLFEANNSTKDGYKNLSKHQSGQAWDFIPFINGKVATDRWYYAMIVSAIMIAANELGFKIRSGTNWDMDNEFITDQTFQDLGHIESV
jgi:peptidoglycan L-alanyl-D-glutamate endopeptidase CwlK